MVIGVLPALRQLSRRRGWSLVAAGLGAVLERDRVEL
jgi:hypothetical protein